MRITPTEIPDVFTIDPVVNGDDRGFFMETWRESHFARAGIDAHFVQEAMSRSSRGVLRGLHYQIEEPQGKLVRAVTGEIFDVAVDIRRSSPTFGRWVGMTLSAENRRALWVPPGFAHGFYVVGELAEVMYRTTAYYAPQHERGLRWNDPDLGITWPVPAGMAPSLVARDAAAPGFREAELYP